MCIRDRSCTLLMKCLSSWLNRLIVTLNKWGYTARPDKHKTHWSTVTADELKSDWLALTLNMALVNKPTIQSYWTTQHINSIFFSTMSRTGYQQILRHLHFVDNSSTIIKDCAENIFLWTKCFFWTRCIYLQMKLYDVAILLLSVTNRFCFISQQGQRLFGFT